MKDVLADPGHDQHESMRQWAGDDFNPTKFDLASAAKRVRAVNVRPARRQRRR